MRILFLLALCCSVVRASEKKVTPPIPIPPKSELQPPKSPRPHRKKEKTIKKRSFLSRSGVYKKKQ